MTYEINQRVRQKKPLENAAPVSEAGKTEKCGACGRATGGGPKLLYMPEVDGRLKEVQMCPICFLKIVLGVRA